MGIRVTGISTPFGGATWEYTGEGDKSNQILVNSLLKIKVFISSICGEEKYDTIRAELKKAIEATGLADVYLFESACASTLTAGSHYSWALEDSDICIFLIDNADGIHPGVQVEIDIVKNQSIKALYYFCDENSKTKTALEQSLTGANFAKSKTVHKFSDLSKDGANALVNDIIQIYHYYCRGKFNLVAEDDNDEFQTMDVAGSEKIRLPTVPKSVLKNIDKCKDYILKFVTGYPAPRFPNEAEQSSEIDEWCVQFFSVLFEGQSIKHFNTGMYLEMLKKIQDGNHYPIVEKRWQAIQMYFLGNIEKCVEILEIALKLAKDTNQPTWVVKDILIDLRNQYGILDSMNNQHSESTAQKALSESNEDVYYPLLDRINESLHEKYIEGMYKKKIASPYTVTLGNDLGNYSELLASSYIVSMYNGSLTHIILLYEKMKNFLFFLSNKYDDWNFRRDMLKLAIFDGNEKEVRGIQDSYPEILNNLSATDAISIMNFCNNHPVQHKRLMRQLLAFGTVGYYLCENDFKKYEAHLLGEINNWLNGPKYIFEIGQCIFPSLSGIAYRMSQDNLSDICCMFIDKGYSRWFIDMFKFIANRVNLCKMSTDSAKSLVKHIVNIFNDENLRAQISYAPYFLCVLRCQSREFTEELDKKILEFFPAYYNGDYLLLTSEDDDDLPKFLQKYTKLIQNHNETQGKNGTFLGYGTHDIATIRSILLQSTTEFSDNIMDQIISTVVDTLLISKEGVGTKLDAVSLLICIVLKYPEDFKRNNHLFKKLYNHQEEIEADKHNIFSSNIDGISLKICLQFLFSAMDIDSYANILELMPYIQSDTPTTISVSKVIAEYLDVPTDLLLPSKIEALILQNVLQWLCSSQLDIRRNATKILFHLARNPENNKIVNHQLISLIDTDNVYIKNLIIRNVYKVDGISDTTRDYIISKCENDVNFVVRMVCAEEKEKHVPTGSN